MRISALPAPERAHDATKRSKSCRAQCATCSEDHFFRSGTCVPCSEQTQLAALVWYDVGVVCGIVVAVVVLWWGLLRPANAIISLKASGLRAAGPGRAFERLT